MDQYLITLARLIENHNYIKILLWAGVLVFGLYIFILEGRIHTMKFKLRRFLNRLSGYKEIDEIPNVKFNISFTARKIKLLRILWYSISIITIILTITY